MTFFTLFCRSLCRCHRRRRCLFSFSLKFLFVSICPCDSDLWASEQPFLVSDNWAERCQKPCPCSLFMLWLNTITDWKMRFIHVILSPFRSGQTLVLFHDCVHEVWFRNEKKGAKSNGMRVPNPFGINNSLCICVKWGTQSATLENKIMQLVNYFLLLLLRFACCDQMISPFFVVSFALPFFL